MQLSIIIPCFNNADTLGAQLDALADQRWDGPWGVIVADNGSTDASREVAESYADRVPKLRVVDASGRRGAAHARNAGVAQSTGDWLGFCDADDVVAQGWVAEVASAMQNNCFVAGRFEFDRLNRPEDAVYRSQEYGLDRLSFAPYCLHAGAGNMAIHRDCFEQLGGFDESMLRLEDTDLCIRMHLHGYRLHFDPEMVLHLRRRVDPWGQFRQSAGYAQNRVRLVAKYAGSEPLAPSTTRLFARVGRQAFSTASSSLIHPERRGYYADRLGRAIGEFLGRLQSPKAPKAPK